MQTITTFTETAATQAARRDFYAGVGNATRWERVGPKAHAAYVNTQREMIADYARLDAIAYEQGI